MTLFFAIMVITMVAMLARILIGGIGLVAKGDPVGLLFIFGAVLGSIACYDMMGGAV